MAIGSSALSGMAAGAALGSAVPLFGTAAGAIGGGLIGAASGWLSQNKKNAPRRSAQALANQQRLQGQLRRAQASEMGRPTMDAEVKSLEGLYNLASQGIPQAQRQLAERDIQRSTQDAIAASNARGGALNTISQITQAAQDANVGLAAEDAALAQGGMLRVGDRLARARGRQEMFNEIEPYQQLLQEAMALEGAGIQNQFLVAQLDAQRGAEMQQNFENTMSGITSLANSGALGGMGGGSGEGLMSKF